MKYSTTNSVAKEVCRKLGYLFEIQWVKASRRNGKTYVSGTVGKPDEWRNLKRDCKQAGYIFTGREV